MQPRTGTTLGIEAYRTLARTILARAPRGPRRQDFLADTARIIADFARCDFVQICVRSGERCDLVTSWAGLEATRRWRLHAEGACSLDRVCRGAASAGAAEPDGVGPQASGAVLAVPIRIDTRSIGMLRLGGSVEGRFSRADLQFYEGLGELLGTALLHDRAQTALRERVKELSCLYGIARAVARSDAARDKVLQETVELLPPAWLHAEAAVARIDLAGRTYRTRDYQESERRLRSPVIVRGKDSGFVEVAYLKELPELDEGPFLAEECSLIDAVAQEVALFVERSRAEEDRTLLQEQLRHADRLATIGQLAAGVAHELNEPLGNVLGFAELILNANEPTQQTRKDLQKIVGACLHAREVIRKLMVFARQQPARKMRLNLNDLIQEGLYFFEARCAKLDIKLVRRLQADLPLITADAGQLNQVLANLMVNAIQAMPDGGTLAVETRALGADVALLVEDTGVGMTEEVKKQIFVPFFTTKDLNEGTGLGLPVVHGIVSAHGGRIDVTTQPGAGTTFEIRLPLEQPDAAAEVPPDGR
ncbi:MAG: GAF domain-containing protein [Planctomycetes bacterium]|nr:GAF domain-containing protein [Planctomycetota bacterium]